MSDRDEIDELTRVFFAAFASGPDVERQMADLRAILLPQAVIVRAGAGEPAVYDVEGFIAPRQQILTDGTLTDFREWDEGGTVEIFGAIAHRFGPYAKAGTQDGKPFTGRGAKSIQFVRTGAGWRISAVAWDDEREDQSSSAAAT